MEEIKSKAETLTIEQLKDGIVSLANDFQDGADIVFGVLLDVLMARVSESDFLEFCDDLDK